MSRRSWTQSRPIERSLVTPDSRFDRWLAGDTGAITPDELAGYQLFKSLGCITCHQGVNVGGNLFQRHGIFHPLGSPEPAIVRVPSLRNVATTAPYFHDGSAATLPEAVKKMGIAQLDRVLTDQQIAAIVAFLYTLTGTYRDRVVRPAAATTARNDGCPMRILPGALGVLLLLALLTWLLLRGIDTNASAYAVTLKAFDDFALAEASLQRDVLQARAGLLRNYDTLVQAAEAIEDAVARLRFYAQSEGLDTGPLDRLATAVAQQEQLTERFKTTNAILQNSLSYVGLLSTGPVSEVDDARADRNRLSRRPLGGALDDVMLENLRATRHPMPSTHSINESSDLPRKRLRSA